ncbi:MAG: A/G-specific adenine glycosylase [Proteobacteria bacterium]|nr:A/G-specific adenine glycosylase [Pseudomonadota bacterium]MBU1581726.1 A/G-specific adenine glycosylase [Pseudomonadota bacterium]MBU2452995.1 A/G-specific adenine glycosylase [Pseudomonadota bacterium]MBU2630744.1 A/G-specific adenine glycosylase [Pseudomonadota bacterium]
MTPQQKDGHWFQEKIEAWYQTHHRKLPWRENKDPYRIWISEVMLQQTQVKTVIPYFINFIKKFPTLDDLAQSDLETILKLWEGLGYYARARNFHKAVTVVSKNLNSTIPDDVYLFKKLPGVGDYITAAVLSIAFGQTLAVVDGNVKRVLARLYCIKYPVNKPAFHKQFLAYADKLLDENDPGTFNQAMMELGALICTPRNPRCPDCPVSEFCRALLSDKVSRYPRRIKTQKVPTFHIAAGIVRKNGTLLITRRKLDGLLGGLWEFPGGKLKEKEDAGSACIREIREETGITTAIESRLTTIHHAYTHFKIIMEVFYCTYISGRIRLNGPIDFRWVKLKDIDAFAFPKANLKFISMIEEK